MFFKYKTVENNLLLYNCIKSGNMINLNLMKNQKRNLKTDSWIKFNETLLAKKIFLQ